MVSSSLRASAREALKGKWGKAALLTLCYCLIMFVVSFVLNLIPVIGQLAQFVISLPLSFGLLVSFVKLKRDEEVNYTDFFNVGFSNFGKVWGVFGNMILKMIIPVALVIVFLIVFIVGIGGSISGAILLHNYGSGYYGSVSSGFSGLAMIGFIGYFASIIYAIVKGYLYSLSYYILYDNPNKSGKEIVELSESMMRGNRWSFFWLGLTFIGWAISSVFTLYIGLLWLMPYIIVTFVCFYETLASQNENKTEENNPVVEE